MASGDIHYRSLVALLPAGLARWSRHESWGMIHEIEVGNPSCRDLHNFTRSQIIWSAWKPNYVFRRRFPIDVQTKSLATLDNKYLAKSWWSNGQKSGMTRCWRAMILRWIRYPASDGIGWSTITHCTSVNSSSAKTRQNRWRWFTSQIDRHNFKASFNDLINNVVLYTTRILPRSHRLFVKTARSFAGRAAYFNAISFQWSNTR